MPGLVRWIVKSVAEAHPLDDRQEVSSSQAVKGLVGLVMGIGLIGLAGLILPYLIVIFAPIVGAAVLGLLLPAKYGRGLVVGAGWTLAYYLVVVLAMPLFGGSLESTQLFLYLVIVPTGLFFLVASANDTPPPLRNGATLILLLVSGYQVTTYWAAQPGKAPKQQVLGSPIPSASDEATGPSAVAVPTASSDTSPNTEDPLVIEAAEEVEATVEAPIVETVAAQQEDLQNLLGYYLVVAIDHFEEPAGLLSIRVEQTEDGPSVFAFYPGKKWRISDFVITEEDFSFSYRDFEVITSYDYAAVYHSNVYSGTFTNPEKRFESVQATSGKVVVLHLHPTTRSAYAEASDITPKERRHYNGGFWGQPFDAEFLIAEDGRFTGSIKPTNTGTAFAKKLLSNAETPPIDDIASRIYDGRGFGQEKMTFVTFASIEFGNLLVSEELPEGKLIQWDLEYDATKDVIRGEAIALNLFTGVEKSLGRCSFTRKFSDLIWPQRSLSPRDGKDLLGLWQGEYTHDDDGETKRFRMAFMPDGKGRVIAEIRSDYKVLQEGSIRFRPREGETDRLEFQIAWNVHGDRHDGTITFEADRVGEEFHGTMRFEGERFHNRTGKLRLWRD